MLDACAGLTEDQLAAPVPGTYGPIIATLRHLVQADSFYLSIFTDGRVPEIDPNNTMTVAELQAAMIPYGPEYETLLAGDLDADAWVIERAGDGSEFHSTLGLRLAQVPHHGSDHRSQVCTALTALGITPPEIDLWVYGEATGRTREVPPPSG